MSFDPFQGKYIKSLPLHKTQEILKDAEEQLLIKLELFITHGFFMELLSFVETVSVIKPTSLINEMENTLTNMMNSYSSEFPL